MTTDPTMTKRDFIRSIPRTVSVQDVIKKAAEGGVLGLTKEYIYRVRSGMKGGRKSFRVGRLEASPSAGRKPGGRAPALGLEVDREFAELAVRVGFDRARVLLDELEERVGDFLASGLK